MHVVDVVDLEPVGDWQHHVGDMMRRVLVALQHSHFAMKALGGRIVVVAPTIGIAGATGLVPYTTAIEGIRAMVKSAADSTCAASNSP